MPRRLTSDFGYSDDPCLYTDEDQVGFVTHRLYVASLLLLGDNKVKLNKTQEAADGTVPHEEHW